METEKKTVVTVPLKTRIAWGFGGLADNYMFNVYNVLFLYVYVNYFNMDPALAGIAKRTFHVIARFRVYCEVV